MRTITLSLAVALGLAALAAACSDDSDPGTGGGPSTGGGQAAGGNGACGDGVVDPALGETCDPPESCGAIDCGGVDACVISTGEGSAATCDLRCTEAPNTACVADGCCVAACGNDPDCVCDASADCNTCFGCAGNAECAAVVDACESSPDCIDYVSCSSACPDQACVDACQQASTPEAIQLFEAWFSCALCDACPTSCMGFSNVAFPGCP